MLRGRETPDGAESSQARRVIISLVEGEHPVREAEPEGSDTIDAPEASVLFVNPPDQLLMSAVAEGSICAHLAVAELEVAGLAHVEADGAAAGQDPLALAVTQRRVLSVTTAAPIVHLPTVEVHVGREDTCEGRHRRRPVLAFLVGATLVKGDRLLGWEVGDVVHGDLGAGLSGGLHDLGGRGQHVSLVGLELTTSGAIRRL